MLLLALVPAASWAIFAGIFLCSPTAKLWDPDISGHCMSAKDYWLSVAGIDIGLDFLVLLLPLPSISGLHLPRKQKAGLILVFSLGFFVCLVSVARLLTVLISSDNGHYIKSGIWAIIWSAVEANVGIMCASLLSLKPLAARLFPCLNDETKPPRHSMHIDRVRAITFVNTRSISIPATPTTIDSKQSSTLQWPSAARFGSIQPVSELENWEVIEPEYPALASRRQGRERLSLFDMLRENEEEARSRIERRSSSFREHV